MSIHRRSFLQRAALASAALLPASTLLFSKNALGATSAEQLSAGDIGVITIGLNNEYLEAEFYLRALTGKGLPSSDITGVGSPGNVLVNSTRPVTFSNPVIQAIADQLAGDELAHVLDVRATFASFGLTPPALPTIDLVHSFQLLATLANLNRHFDPLGNETDFLLASFFFEENCSALLVGAIGALENNDLKSTVASLLGDEAAHSGFIRLGLTQEHSHIVSEANKIAQLKQKLAASNTTIFQPLVDNGRSILSPVGTNATVIPLTPQQFFNNVLLSLNASAGGFFPNGLNLA
ncbi:MAG TPA: ferritin-like domain-containing protein [Chthoniobacterales bacterium]|jgi:hypothetical protein|nr:ferritin-like domain-containing protein [Chthoniobacterales bacterium]